MSPSQNGRKGKDHGGDVRKLLLQLQERAKELNCLYQVEEALGDPKATDDEVYTRIIAAIPPGWQYPDVCVARIRINGRTYSSPAFAESEWRQNADIVAGDSAAGDICVFYTEEMPPWDDGPFLKEEAKLIRTIADRIGHHILHQRLRTVMDQTVGRADVAPSGQKGEWQVVVQMLKQTDRNLYLSISRKMLNHLCWSGVEEAESLMRSFTPDPQETEAEMLEDMNQPFQRHSVGFSSELCQSVFKIASDNLPDEEILRLIQKWIQEDKLSFLVQVVNRNLTLSDVADAIRRYHYLAENEPGVTSPNKRGIEVSLIRRFLSDQLPYINVAKRFIEVHDFFNLLGNIIYTTESHGKLGGKSAGMYLASQILKREAEENELLAEVKIPKTYFITSDVLLQFMHFNNFDEVVEQKYKPINQVRFEYPHIVQTFKSARFPAEISKSLSVALDDFGERPLIVRSSSLLEDRIGAAFSGKYKSLFLANQGTKQQRLEALMDAIAEVYASTFGPDPIEYRAERGLIDFGEEMGIIIQEVVGTKVGHYFLPSFAGVAFSRNEFRWSPRIKREDGLTRLVPGLGTRAVDRLSDDYPVLIAPGQPGLRANTTPDEIARYSPNNLDVVNLQTNTFDTIPVREFVRQTGEQLPAIEQIVSLFKDDTIRAVSAGISVSGESDDLVVTFEGLITRTPIVSRIKAILDTLEQTMGMPVDIEFAHDGRDFYLLQCRAQSYSQTAAPAPIPKGTPKEHVLFTANKYVSNGSVSNVTHIVYVDPQSYSDLPDRASMVNVGRAVGFLNKVLPKRRFVLMGPGRWGSRGDIKLGVSVTYSDINNTGALIEIARKRGNYVPDLSFGTHFFQDLVEADIRYLPLYPDDEDIVFNDRFLFGSDNLLPEVAPDFAELKETIRLIEVPKNAAGRLLSIYMNADLDEAIGVLTQPSEDSVPSPARVTTEPGLDEHFWRWRLYMVEQIARELEPDKFGVVNLYVLGSTKNATAGPSSDIDILVHFRGSPEQLDLLSNWLEGWSLCLGETNYMQTGYRTGGLLDVHIVTDEDIANKTSWAAKIGAVTDAARPLKLGKSADH